MRFLVMAALALISLTAMANTAVSKQPELGKPVPALTVSDRGELQIDGDTIRYRPWSTASLRGQWTLLQYMAARPRASKVNRPVVDAVSLKKSQGVAVDVVNIINVSDVPFGATGFALAELESNKRRYPDSTLIGDMDQGRQGWQLAPGGSAILLIDPKGLVRFFKDGTVSQQELETILAMLPGAGER